jgi:putative transposase
MSAAGSPVQPPVRVETAHYQTPLISQAIRNAARNRKLASGAIFHSDRGSNYMSTEFAATLKQFGLRRSSGRTGVCWDNAMAE